MIGKHEIDTAKVFGFHPATAETGPAHDAVRRLTKLVADTYLDWLPKCPETTIAIRDLQNAMMHANSAIAQHGIPDAKNIPSMVGIHFDYANDEEDQVIAIEE